MANDTPNPRGPDAVTHQLPAGELPAGWMLLGGQYEIVRLIASGGFGITYLARDTLGRDVAVKECFPLGLAQRQAATHAVSATSAGTSEHFETARAQFLREARMLAALRHPNVVHVQTLFEENGTAYMAMDFIHGRDLHEEIVAAEGGISPPRVLELARDILGALDYVHGQGVLHRDIKPQNIRIDRFGVPMLIDFGAARAETQARSRMAGTFRVVTDGYSPHEFYVSGAAQGPHSDLYALAATLHHVITGKAPVPADERASALATGKPDPYQPIAEACPDHDTRLLHLIDRALRMAPEQRPAKASVWLAALADAPTTLVAPAAAAPVTSPSVPTRPARSRFVPGAPLGAALGVALMGGVAAAVWAMQPAWLSPGMDTMMERMGQLEDSLAMAEAARAAAEAELGTLRGTLAEAETTLAALRAADGDMAATMAELEAAQSARDAAAAQVAALEADLADLAATQAALEEARADRDAAEARARLLTRDGVAAAARIAELEAAATEAGARTTALEAQLAEATAALETASARADMLMQVESDLTEAEAALYAVTTRASALERQLQQALEGNSDLAALQAELQTLEDALIASEAERTRLQAQIATALTLPSRDANAGEIERLRDRIAELEAENSTLRAALARAEAAIVQGTPQAPIDGATGGTLWTPSATLQAPNGTLSLLPRFSWDNRSLALVDSSGGIALFDRDTGAYRAHLARGIPDPVIRMDFSTGGGFLIATTADGTADRLYDIAAQREILRFNPTTVTTANRAISSDEQFFVYTREGPSGETNAVLVPLREAVSGAATGAAPERILTSVPAGETIRVAFAETSNEITVVTSNLVRLYLPDGTLQRTVGNRLGVMAAMSPVGGDQGILVLRGNGDIVLFDTILDQTVTATIPARATYTRFRLSGDLLSFLRANAQTWDVVDLLSGRITGSGPVGQGYEAADVSISADGATIFIGAVGAMPARLLDVATGAELQQFGDATEGYFSFDNRYLATGQAETSEAQIWTMDATASRTTDALLPGCPLLDALPGSTFTGRDVWLGEVSATIRVGGPHLFVCDGIPGGGVYPSLSPTFGADFTAISSYRNLTFTVEAECDFVVFGVAPDGFQAYLDDAVADADGTGYTRELLSRDLPGIYRFWVGSPDPNVACAGTFSASITPD